MYHWKISSNVKFSYPNLWKSEKKCMYWGLHCHQVLSGKSKNYALSLLYNITQIWQLLSVSTRKTICLAVIWVKIWGLHKKLLWSNIEDYTVTRNRVLLKWFQWKLLYDMQKPDYSLVNALYQNVAWCYLNSRKLRKTWGLHIL